MPTRRKRGRMILIWEGEPTVEDLCEDDDPLSFPYEIAAHVRFSGIDDEYLSIGRGATPEKAKAMACEQLRLLIEGVRSLQPPNRPTRRVRNLYAEKSLRGE